MRIAFSEIDSTCLFGSFSTGSTVTISLYDISDDSSIELSSSSCSEIGTTGVFKFALSNITTKPTTYKQYLYVMTDSLSSKIDVFEIGGWVQGISSSLIEAETCKVYANISKPDDKSGIRTSRLYSDVDRVYAKLTATYYDENSSKFFDLDEIKPSYDQLTRQAYWIFPRGASVKFFIKPLGVNATVTIPYEEQADLNTLLS